MTYSPRFRGTFASGASKQLVSGFPNNSGSTIAQCAPVTVDSSGNITPVDVSSEASADSIVGVMALDAPHGTIGKVSCAGRVENVTLGFNVGDVVYVSKAGFLTNLLPDIGVGGFAAGDWIIFIGIMCKNEDDPLLKDLQLLISTIGQL